MVSIRSAFVAASFAARATAATTKINVGQSGLSFSPNSVTASMGDTLEFHFFPQNHSVVMGDFNNACQPASSGGFYSGFMPTSSGEAPDVFTVTINSTDPIAFYCSQPLGSHCVTGMVGVVNPSGSNTLANFQAAAKNAKNIVSPASVMGGVVGPAPSSSGSSSSSTSSAASSSTTTSSSSGGGGGGGYGSSGGSSGGSGAATMSASLVGALAAVGAALFMA